MTAQPPSDWLEQGQNAVWFFGTAFAGFCVFLFGRPIQHERRTGYANRGGKRKPKQKRTVKKKLTVQKQKKAKKQKQKPRYVPPPMSPEQHARVAKYYRERDGIKSDEWSGYGGGIPL